jgi:hypothetical protein
MGTVTVGARAAACSSWNDTHAVCTVPPGVAAAQSITVTTAAGSVSAVRPGVTVAYLPPALLSVRPGRVGTRGGVALALAGASLAPGLRVSVWLAPAAAATAPALAGVAPWLLPGATECGAVTAVTATSARCVAPAGAGTGWAVVAVNHDGPVGAVGGLWRASTASAAVTLAYRAPAVRAVRAVPGWGANSSLAAVAAELGLPVGVGSNGCVFVCGSALADACVGCCLWGTRLSVLAAGPRRH